MSYLQRTVKRHWVEVLGPDGYETITVWPSIRFYNGKDFGGCGLFKENWEEAIPLSEEEAAAVVAAVFEEDESAPYTTYYLVEEARRSTEQERSELN